MRAYMKTLLPIWVSGDAKTTNTASCRDYKFYSYNTLIAYIENDTVHLNKERYSQTTSSQQKAIKEYAEVLNYKIVEF